MLQFFDLTASRHSEKSCCKLVCCRAHKSQTVKVLGMLSPQEILQRWELHYGELDHQLKDKFLLKPEVLKLAILPSEHVALAIRKHKSLKEALLVAAKTAELDHTLTREQKENVRSLNSSDAIKCIHGIKSFERCKECREIRPFSRQKKVWLSGAGGKFHYDKNCRFARDAQERFRLKGGIPHHWYSASECAVRWDREPCNWCVRKHPLSFEWLKEDLHQRPDDYKPLVNAKKSHSKKVKEVNGFKIEPGANLQGANLQGANLVGTRLQCANLKGANLQDANLQDANLQDANLQDANLNGANLSSGSLQNPYLHGANLEWANLRGANLQSAKLHGAGLRGADLEGANLSDADLQGAYLQDANLRNAILKDANLSWANLERADLDGANLSNVNLQDAFLRGAKLSGVNLSQAKGSWQ